MSKERRCSDKCIEKIKRKSRQDWCVESKEDFRGQRIAFAIPSLIKIDNENYSTFYPHFLNYYTNSY